MWCTGATHVVEKGVELLASVVNSSTLVAGMMGVPPVRSLIAASLLADVPASDASASAVELAVGRVDG